MGPILVKNILRRVPFHKICKKKIVKSAIFDAEKPSEKGLDLQKFWKTVYSDIFEWEKSFDMGRGFRPRAAHSVKK